MSQILIVDDDADLLEILSYFLTLSGYETSTLPKGGSPHMKNAKGLLHYWTEPQKVRHLSYAFCAKGL